MTYLVTLKPLGNFFFGGETTFADAGESDAKGRYFASSEYFPQQTQLLGMLKKYLLNTSGTLRLRVRGEWIGKREPQARYEKALHLAGRTGFNHQGSGDHGIIRSISPIMLHDGKSFWTMAPKDYGLIYEELEGVSCFGFDDEERPYIPMLKNYSAKAGIKPKLMSSEGSELCSFDTFFTPADQVGIEKAPRGATNDDAFYRKRSYRFAASSHTFAVVVELSESFDFTTSQVLLGGEKSALMLTATPTDFDWRTAFAPAITPAKAVTKITLLCDALLDHEAYALCRFALTQKRAFRTLRSGDTKQAYIYQGKTQKLYFMERGSVLYVSPSDVATLVAKLTNPTMQAIGYNQYIITQGAQ